MTATAAVGGGGPAELAALGLLLAGVSAEGLALRTAAGSLLEAMRGAAKRRFDRLCGLVLLASAATMAAQVLP